MKLMKLKSRKESGALLVDLMAALPIALTAMGVLVYSSMSIGKNITATDQYMVGVANTNRMIDAITVDLRRALRVSVLTGGTATPIKDTGATAYTVSGSTILVIHVPDSYGSNTPNNSGGSTYKSSRYSRATLNTSSLFNLNANPLLNGIVPWSEAQTTVSGKAVTRFAPVSAGTGELQIRYYTGQRSTTDATQCFLRSEYPSGATSPSSTREIAERITDSTSTCTVAVSGLNGGKTIRLESSFTPRFRLTGATTAPTTAVVEVKIRNPRRD